MNNVQVTVIKNPFKPHDTRETKYFPVGKSVRELVQEFFPLAPSDLDIVASINGKILKEDLNNVFPEKDDSVVFTTVPKGGGGGGSNPLKVVAMVAVMVAATFAAPYVTSALMGSLTSSGVIGLQTAINATAMVNSLITGAMMVGGGLLINAVMPSATSGLSSSASSFETSPTYSWDSSGNTAQEGSVLPILYGEMRVYPYLIGANVTTDSDSNQTYNLLYAVAGHEVDSISDIYIEDQPLSYYDDVQIYTRLGKDTQDVIPNFMDTTVDTTVGVTMSTGQEVIRQTEGDGIEKVGVTISFPRGLYYANDEGGLDKVSSKVKISYRKYGDSTWIDYNTYTVSGAQTDAIIKSYYIDNLDPDKYEVKVTLVSKPPDTSRYGSTVVWSTISETVKDDFTYPGVALLSVQALATDQLSGSIPKVSCKVIRSNVPVHTGVDYEDMSASNPAWACYDLLHNEDYGGNQAASKINYEDFYEWATFCEENDLSCNLYIDSFLNMSTALSYISQCGRASVVLKGSTFGCIVDKPELPTQMFTVGNIVKDTFQITYLDQSERANCIDITYYDKEQDYSSTTIQVRDQSFNTEDEISQQITLYGCVDRDQAIRHAKFLLNCNKLQIRMVSFDVDIDALAVTVGDVIKVQSDITQYGFGGRIVSATYDSVTLDQSIYVEKEKTYFIEIRNNEDDEIITKEIVVSDTGEFDEFQVKESFDDIPSQYELYSFGEELKVTKPFRVISITRSQEFTRKITAIEYYDECYDDTIIVEDVTDYSSLTKLSNLQLEEVWITKSDGSGESRINASWNGVALNYYVYIQYPDQPWQKIATTNKLNYTTSSMPKNVEIGIAVSPSDDLSLAIAKYITIQGKNYQPDAPINPEVVNDVLSNIIKWEAPNVIDIAYYEVWHSLWNDRDGIDEFEDGDYDYGNNIGELHPPAELIAKVNTTYFVHQDIDTTLNHYYWVRVVDNSGQVSSWYPYNYNEAMISEASYDGTKIVEKLQGQITESTLHQDLMTTIANSATEFQESESYTIGDKVVYKWSIYESIKENPAPSFSPDYSEYWYDTGTRVSDVAIAQERLDAIDGEWTVKINNNGKVAGVGLMNDGDVSTFEILANRFAVVDPDNIEESAAPFVISDGKVAIDGELIVDGSITADSFVSDLAVVNTIRSQNYSPSTSGWKLSGDSGIAELNNIKLNINDKFIVNTNGDTTIRSNSSGERLEITNNVVKVYDSNGTLRVQLGDLSE